MAFQTPKCSASGNAKPKYCKFFLQYCYNPLQLHCSKILKYIIFFYSHFLTLSLSHFMLLFVSHLIPLSTMASLSHHISLSLPVPTRFFSFEKCPSKPRLKRLEQFIEEDLHLLGVSRVGFLEVGLW